MNQNFQFFPKLSSLHCAKLFSNIYNIRYKLKNQDVCPILFHIFIFSCYSNLYKYSKIQMTLIDKQHKAILPINAILFPFSVLHYRMKFVLIFTSACGVSIPACFPASIHFKSHAILSAIRLIICKPS